MERRACFKQNNNLSENYQKSSCTTAETSVDQTVTTYPSCSSEPYGSLHLPSELVDMQDDFSSLLSSSNAASNTSDFVIDRPPSHQLSSYHPTIQAYFPKPQTSSGAEWQEEMLLFPYHHNDEIGFCDDALTEMMNEGISSIPPSNNPNRNKKILMSSERCASVRWPETSSQENIYTFDQGEDIFDNSWHEGCYSIFQGSCLAVNEKTHDFEELIERATTHQAIYEDNQTNSRNANLDQVAEHQGAEDVTSQEADLAVEETQLLSHQQHFPSARSFIRKSDRMRIAKSSHSPPICSPRNFSRERRQSRFCLQPVPDNLADVIMEKESEAQVARKAKLTRQRVTKNQLDECLKHQDYQIRASQLDSNHQFMTTANPVTFPLEISKYGWSEIGTHERIKAAVVSKGHRKASQLHDAEIHLGILNLDDESGAEFNNCIEDSADKGSRATDNSNLLNTNFQERSYAAVDQTFSVFEKVCGVKGIALTKPLVYENGVISKESYKPNISLKEPHNYDKVKRKRKASRLTFNRLNLAKDEAICEDERDGAIFKRGPKRIKLTDLANHFKSDVCIHSNELNDDEYLSSGAETSETQMSHNANRNGSFVNLQDYRQHDVPDSLKRTQQKRSLQSLIPATDFQASSRKRRKGFLEKKRLQGLLQTDANVIAHTKYQAKRKASWRATLNSERKDEIQNRDTMAHRESRARITTQSESTQHSLITAQEAPNAAPTTAFLNMRDQNSYAAQLSFAKGCGFDAHNDTFMKPTVLDLETDNMVFKEEDIAAMSNMEPITSDELLKCMRKFMEATDSGQAIGACASCGITSLQFGKDFRVFELFSDAVHAGRTLAEIFQIRDDFSNPDHIVLLQHYTTGPFHTIRTFAAINSICFHLHSDLVIYNKDQIPVTSVKVPLCRHCTHHVSKGTVPKYNVKFCDFGNLAEYQRIVLGCKGAMLSLAERSVASRSIVFQTIVKYAGNDRPFHKGHCITLNHDGAVVLDQVLPRTDPEIISTLISAAFVGKKRDFDIHQKDSSTRKQFLRNLPLLQVHSNRVMSFLRFKHAMDPYYSDVTIKTPTEQLIADLDIIPEIILSNALLCDGDTEQALDKLIHDSVTASGTLPNADAIISDDEIQQSETNSEVHMESDHNVQLEPVFISKKLDVTELWESRLFHALNRQCFTQTETTSNEGVTVSSLQVAAAPAHGHNGHIATSLSCSEQAAHSTNNLQIPICLTPINEYSNNRDLLVGSFPDLFLLGQGPLTQSSLRQSDINHMILHYDCRFSQNAQFLFLLFNQQRRHATAAHVNVKVKGGSEAVNAFQETVNAPDFKTRLQDAIAHPESIDAKKLARSLNRITSIVGAMVPWTEEKRQYAKFKLMALVSYSGPFSYFVTISLADMDSTLALRISNTVDKLEHSSSQFNNEDRTTNLNFMMPSWKQRNATLALDPVAYARVYKMMLESFLLFLVGRAPEYLLRADPRYTGDSTNFTGIFGCVFTYGFVTEEQKRGSAHTHGVITCDLSPISFQKYINDPRVLSKLCARVDSIVQAYISNWNDANYLSKVISTYSAGCKDKEISSQRDTRYKPTESHSRKTIELSNSHKILLETSTVVESINVDVSTEQQTVSVSEVSSSKAAAPTLTAIEIADMLPSECQSGTSTFATSTSDDLVDTSLCESEEDFESLMKRQMAVIFKNNVHEHSFTCHKTAAGEKRCRMCYPRPCCNRPTCFVEIEFEQATGRPKARTRFNVKVNKNDPLLDTADERVIVLELFRPGDNYDAANPTQNSTDNNETGYWVDRELGKNSNVVSFSPALSAMFASNSNVEILGNWAQSKNATYYIIKYMIKDDGSVQTILPVLWAAHRKIIAKPSIAEDTGTASRSTKHILNVLLNTLNGKTEVGGQTAALSLLGLPSEIFSHEFTFVYPWPAIKFCSAFQLIETDPMIPRDLEEPVSSTQSDAFGALTTNSDASSVEPIDPLGIEIDADIHLGGLDPNVLFADENSESGVREIVAGGSASAEVQTVAQFENYFYRLTASDRRLEDMTLYEWVANIKVCKVSQRKSSDHNTRNEASFDNSEELNDAIMENETGENANHSFAATPPQGPGRRKNDTFPFHFEHKISQTHFQRIRSKTVIPMLAGRPAPPHPGPRQNNAAWHRKADAFSAYYLVLHRPFSFLQPLSDLSYQTLMDYIFFLEDSSSYLDKARLHWMKLGAHGLSIKAKEMKLLSSYRGRMAHYWNGKLDGSPSNEVSIECNPFDLDRQNDTIGEDVLNRLHDMYNSFSLEMDDDQIALNRQIQDSIDRLRVLDLTLPCLSNHGADSENSNDNNARFDLNGEDEIKHHLNIFKSIKSNKLDESINASSARNETGLSSETFHPMPQALSSIMSSSVSIEDDMMLNLDQQTAFKFCLKWYNEYSDYLQDPHHNTAPAPLLAVILGAAGTGKSFFIQRLIQRVNKPGAVRCAAPTGVAASNLDGGAFTCHSLFAMPWDEHGSKSSKKVAGNSRLQEAKLNLGSDVRIIVIDEFSMLSEQQFCLIDQRLRAWTEKDAPFGGIGIILMGDPFQIPPVLGKSLIKAATENHNKAGLLFTQFTPFQFSIQQRASSDEVHSRRLEFFRRPSDKSMPVPESGILNSLKELDQDDVIADPGWKEAVIIVSGNEQRVQLNLARAVAFARSTDQPVIAFRLALKSGSMQQLEAVASSLGVTTIDLLKNEHELSFYFVKGAPVAVTENVNIIHHIANGTRGKLDSITLHPSISEQEWRKIYMCQPGEIPWLPDGTYPVSVNIAFDHIAIDTWNSQWTLNLDKVVVPFSLCSDSSARIAKTGQLKKSQCFIRTFLCELAFAVTFHKVQGRTENKVIIDFNSVGKRGRICDLASFYVAVSRVRNSGDIRVLPIRPETKKKLEKLRFSRHLIDWYTSANSKKKK